MREKLEIGGWLEEPLESFKEHLAYPHLPGSDLSADPVKLQSPAAERHDQGPIGSCVANAVVRAVEVQTANSQEAPARLANRQLSRLALYYLARELVSPESLHTHGSYISSALEAARVFGIPPEEDWPYVPQNEGKSPPWRAMRRAVRHRIRKYERINVARSLRPGIVIDLLQKGRPTIFGVYTGHTLREYQKGQTLLPHTGTVEGGHAMIIVGWTGHAFVVENSWGTRWGDRGTALVGPDYITSILTKELWTITMPWEA